MFFGAKMPIILPQLFPSLIWKKSTIEKKVWLTFDDGPTPKITPFVLDTLLFYNVKATFFCLGKQVLKHPEILQRIKAEGHSIGNHSYSHPNGFTACTNKYLEDVKKCQQIIPETKLFRPPFGNIYPWQITKLKKEYKIIL